MADVTVQKRKEVYQYKFEIASIDGKRKFKNKSGFATILLNCTKEVNVV